jgi:isopropylmalate/homocitrate/citramalate synthase
LSSWASIDQHAAAVEEELEITKELSEHMSHSIEVSSPAMNRITKEYCGKEQGFTSPNPPITRRDIATNLRRMRRR